MIYRMNKEKVNSYALRELMFTALIIFSVFAIFYIWLSQFMLKGVDLGGILMKALPMFLLIMTYVFGTMFWQHRNIGKSLGFNITDHAVEKILISNELNAMNKFGMQRNQSRYGTKMNQTIPYNQIQSISINSTRIKIRSGNYSFFNGNGEVKIPKEVHQYDDLVKHFKKLKTELNIQ